MILGISKYALPCRAEQKAVRALAYLLAQPDVLGNAPAVVARCLVLSIRSRPTARLFSRRPSLIVSIVTQIAAVFNAFCKNSVLTFSHEMSIFSQNYLFDVNFLTLSPLQDLLAACIRAKSTTYRLTAVKMLLPRAHFSAIIISNIKSADAALTKKGTSAFKIRPFCSIFFMNSKENTYPVTGADMPPTGTMRMRLGTHTIAPSPPSSAGI